jgi:hypothetical protein
MAEHIKRRVAAARLAVAFAASATIAGTAWAQAGTPPPTAQSSAFDAFLKIDSIKGENIADGSLLFKDFKKFEVPSYKEFHKVEAQGKHFQKVVFNRYYSKADADKLFIKGESSDYIKRSEISSYVKSSEADARYIKLSDSVVRGDGSVFTKTAQVASTPARLLEVPGMFTVDASGPTITITNTSGAPLQHSSCTNGQTPVPGGSFNSGAQFSCNMSDASQSLQLIGQGASPQVATLSFSAIPVAGSPNKQATVQILIGL